MFLFLSVVACATDWYSDDIEYQDSDRLNWHLGKSIKKIVKKVTKPIEKVVKAVTHPIEKVVTAPVKATLKLVSQLKKDSKSMFENPVVIQQIETSTNTGKFVKGTTSELASDLVSNFGLSADLVNEFFSTTTAVASKSSNFNTFDMDWNESAPTQRFGKLQFVNVKYQKFDDGMHQVDVKAVTGTADVIADMTIRKSKRFLFWSSHSTSVKFRALTSDELTQLYNALNDAVTKQ